MRTFSQMVDEIVSEVRRPDLTSDTARYLNQTIRECHISTDRNAIQFYHDNTREIQLTTTVEDKHVWAIPRPTQLQKMGAVNYLNQFTIRGDSVWAKPTTPGHHLRDLTHYYYQVGQSFVFSNTGPVGSKINLYWFEFPASLPYFAATCRPMVYDSYGGKVYSEPWVCDDAQDDADCISTNWLIERWSDVVSEGVRAKIYKRLSDTERARTCYSMYMQLRQGLVTAETAMLYQGD